MIFMLIMLCCFYVYPLLLHHQFLAFLRYKTTLISLITQKWSSTRGSDHCINKLVASLKLIASSTISELHFPLRAFFTDFCCKVSYAIENTLLVDTKKRYSNIKWSFKNNKMSTSSRHRTCFSVFAMLMLVGTWHMPVD